MAQGVTISFAEDMVVTSRFQMTKNDDILNIIGVTVTMKSPAGDLFTNEGNDTVLIDNSTLVAEGVNLAFYLGSGDDTLTVNNSTISATISTGSGNDIVFVKDITLDQTLSFGSGDDQLELLGTLNNIGSIDFGSSGTGTLRFNGGSLLGDGEIKGITNLEVSSKGGTIGCNLVFSVEEISIPLNGSLLCESDDKTISFSETLTTLHVENDVKTNIGFVLTNGSLSKLDNGLLEIYRKNNETPLGRITKQAFFLDNSDVNINNIQINGNYDCAKYFGNAKVSGGAIVQNSGIMSLTNASFVSNCASAYAYGNYTYRATAIGGAIVLNSGTMSLTSASFTNNCAKAYTADYASGYASGGAIVQNGGVMHLTSVSFNSNCATASNFAAGGAIIQSGGTANLTNVSFLKNSVSFAGNNVGGAICQLGGIMTLSGALFDENTADSAGGAINQSGGTTTLVNAAFYDNHARYGGALFLANASAVIENTCFVNNSAFYGGAIYVDGKMKYSVTAGHDLLNAGNRTTLTSCGGFLYLSNHSIIDFVIEQNAKLTIGNPNCGDDCDSIASDEEGTIHKKGSGYLVINSNIDYYTGTWIVSEGTIELSSPTGRNIFLKDWTIESKGMLVLSMGNDTISMEKPISIGGIFDVGGGKDLIKTNGYDLSEGQILFSNLTITGNGHIGAKLQNRSETDGSSLTLDGATLDSDYTGNDYDDEITINQSSALNGIIEMGDGINSIYVNGTLASTKGIKIKKGGETSIYAYYGSTITDNKLTVYADETATRDVVTLDWSDQTDLDKVRILVSSDSTFETFEFNVELYNQSKKFTLDLQQGYFIQLQAMDEDGWKQRLVADTAAPNQVTGVVFNGKTLSWDAAHDNMGGNGVMQYHVEISEDASFSIITQSGTVEGTEYTPTSLPEATLYFRVSAEDFTNNIGAWSEMISYHKTGDNIPPEKPVASADITSPTSGSVTVTATFSDDSVVREYSLDGQDWQPYVNGVTVTENGNVYFRSADAADNFSEVTRYEITNIYILQALEKPIVSANIITPTNQSVTVSATFDANAAKNEYSIDNLVWASYMSGVLMPENGTVYFRSSDQWGNSSDVASYTVSNIDKVLPTISNLKADITAPTNQTVTVTADFADDVELAQSLYKLGEGGIWSDYADGVILTDNTTVYFKAVDTAGNEAEAAYAVGNIDKVPPTKPKAAADITDQTNAEVKVSAIFSNDSIVREYSRDEQNWNTYTDAVSFMENGVVYFRGKDEAGNYSEITSYTVNNITSETGFTSSGLVVQTGQSATVFSEEVFLETSISSGARLIVSSGGTANDTMINYSGNMDVATGGIAYNTMIGNYAVMNVFSGGIATNNRLHSDAKVYLFNGGIADNNTITGGYLHVNSGATAENNIVSTLFGGVFVSSGGTAYCTTLIESGRMLVESGGTATGPMTFEKSANVTFSSGAILNFNISGINPDNVSFVNDLAVIKGAPCYTLTVSDMQSEGTYNLADGAAEFRGTITVKNTLGTELGSLTVGSAEGVGSMNYTLNIIGNALTVSIAMRDISDTVAPVISNVQADIAGPTNHNVTITATFTDETDLVRSLYRIGATGEWTDYLNGVTISENTTVYFKAIDAAGNESEVVSYTVSNIDTVAPSAPSELIAVVSDPTVVLIWNPSTDDASGIKEYVVKYSRNGQEFTATVNNTNYVLTGLASGSWTWSVQAVDLAGNKSTMTSGNSFDIAGEVVEPLSDVVPRTQTWEKAEENTQYVVEYSTDNFEHVIRLAVDSNSLDSFQMPAGNYQWRVKPEGGEDWTVGEPVTATAANNEPKLVKSNKDGNADVFFANVVETWEAGYVAQHVGSINDWNGTNEYVAVYGKNKLADIIEGSTDANILLLTDGDNGDALFVDDIYTDLPGSVAEQQSRIAQIDEIRAGAGDDIVDMTSQRFEYIGDGLTIRGGEGNDTIWANKGDNLLFGDAGNDRIVGASGNDVIAGGIGNDRMHGGGGDDVFTFCDNWGTDEIEQLATGSVTLWFTSGSEANWNAETLTYTDGYNSVKVSGVTADKITLKFGDDSSAHFATLSSRGAFADFTSEKIFEKSGKGILA